MTAVQNPSVARRRLRRLAAVTAVATVSCLTAGTAFSTTAGAASGSVSLVAYSTPKPAYAALIKAFNADRGRQSGVTFSQSYGPSGTQATSVVEGLPADVVNFSLAPDMEKLVKAGLVSPTWDKRPHQGHGHRLDRVVRRPQGQPEAHHHLGRPREARRPGRSRPTRSARAAPGGTSWPPTAPSWSWARRKAQAQAYLSQLLKNTVAQPTSASTALPTFLSGRG